MLFFEFLSLFAIGFYYVPDIPFLNGYLRTLQRMKFYCLYICILLTWLLYFAMFYGFSIQYSLGKVVFVRVNNLGLTSSIMDKDWALCIPPLYNYVSILKLLRTNSKLLVNFFFQLNVHGCSTLINHIEHSRFYKQFIYFERSIE